jgi:hypothetical protein
MNAALTSTDFIQASLPLAMPCATGRARMGGSVRRARLPVSVPRLIRSVVDEAGLGKFVYLQGTSGRRYVFSSIRPEQASLYDHALIAIAGKNGRICLAACTSQLSAAAGPLYVHLLEQSDRQGLETLDDLCDDF